MRKPPTHSRADIRAAIKLMESLGKVVTAIKLHPDGTFRLMTADHAKTVKPDPATTEANEWDSIQ